MIFISAMINGWLLSARKSNDIRIYEFNKYYRRFIVRNDFDVVRVVTELLIVAANNHL